MEEHENWVPVKFATRLYESAGIALMEFYRNLEYVVSAVDYLTDHGRLPASDRTSCFSGARCRIIMKWRYGRNTGG